MEIRVGETAYNAEFNGFTPVVYSRCFFVKKPNGMTRPKDISEAVGSIAANLDTFGFPAIAPMLEIFYACIKTAQPSFDVKFDDWVRSFPADAYDLAKGDGWASDVMQELVEPNFFPRPKQDGVDAETAEEAKPAAAE